MVGKRSQQILLFDSSDETILGEIESLYSERGETVFVGVDEAGRGPLAGPVVAAAVVLPLAHELSGLDDSKKLTAQRREALFGQIQHAATAWSVQQSNCQKIDEINILQATFVAMQSAVSAVLAQLSTKGRQVDRILVDGNMTIPDMEKSLLQTAVVKGDQRSVNVAAASILAKVTRDRIMVKFDECYPGYGFARHKGYPTANHRSQLKVLGPSPVHRRSFRGVAELIEDFR